MAARLTAYLVVVIVAGTLIAGLIVGAQRDDNDGPVDLIVTNAAVYTADGHSTMAEAVAVRGNQILRVGSKRDIARFQRPQTIVVDAHGGAVVPGFNDAHLDLIGGGLSLGAVDLGDASDADDVLERVRAWGAANPSRAWIVGRNWTAEHFRGGQPSRQALDTAIPDRPALLFGEQPGTVWVNSKALQAAGITRRTPDPDGGTIVREPRTKEPAGVLHGAAAELVSRLIPPPTAEDKALALRRALAAANALGITSAQVPYDSSESLAAYDGLRRAGELTVRIYSALPVTAPLTDAALEALDAVRTRYPDDPLVKTGALTFKLDGPVETGSAALLRRYAGAEESDEAAGETAFTPDDLNRSVRLADAAGWQVITDATGDRAVHLALNAYAHAARSNRAPARGRRHRIETLALVDAEDITRFGPLGVLASAQPAAAMPSAQRLEALTRLLGEARAARAFPVHSLAADTKLLLGSRWPEASPSPLLGLHVAVNRTTPDGLPDGGWQPAERLAVERAVDAYTAVPAWASFDDQRKGSITQGMLADLVVLSDDVFTIPSEKLSSVSVAFTIFDGKIVYSRTPRAETAPAPSLPH